MNPPATTDQIAHAEKELGVAFPDDVKALYRLLNGQDEPAVHAADDAEYEYQIKILPSVEEGNIAFSCCH